MRFVCGGHPQPDRPPLEEPCCTQTTIRGHRCSLLASAVAPQPCSNLRPACAAWPSAADACSARRSSEPRSSAREAQAPRGSSSPPAAKRVVLGFAGTCATTIADHNRSACVRRRTPRIAQRERSDAYAAAATSVLRSGFVDLALCCATARRSAAVGICALSRRDTTAVATAGASPSSGTKRTPEPT
jgi:hypothetical protein